MKYLILLAPLLLTACSNSDNAIPVTAEAVAYGTKLCQGSGGVKNYKAVRYICSRNGRLCGDYTAEYRVTCVNGLQGTYTLPDKE